MLGFIEGLLEGTKLEKIFGFTEEWIVGMKLGEVLRSIEDLFE